MKLANQLAQKLESSGKKTTSLFKSMKDEDWSIEVYSDGPAWNVHNLLAHFTEVEKAIPRLIKEILDGSPGVEKDFDINRFNAKHVTKLSRLKNEELISAFAKGRNSTIQMVTKFTERDLDVWGRHPFLGKSQIKDMVKLMYLHIRIHERDIRTAMRKHR